MALWDHIVDGFLKLFVPDTHAHSTVHLICREGRGKQVAKFVIPHCAQTNVLQQWTGGEGVLYQVLSSNVVLPLSCTVLRILKGSLTIEIQLLGHLNKLPI